MDGCIEKKTGSIADRDNHNLVPSVIAGHSAHNWNTFTRFYLVSLLNVMFKCGLRRDYQYKHMKTTTLVCFDEHGDSLYAQKNSFFAFHWKFLKTYLSVAHVTITRATTNPLFLSLIGLASPVFAVIGVMSL